MFASNSLKLSFKLFLLTDVGNCCKERETKLSINIYTQISRNLGSSFLDFGNFFSYFLTFQSATFQHFTSAIGTGLQRGKFAAPGRIPKRSRDVHRGYCGDTPGEIPETLLTNMRIILSPMVNIFCQPFFFLLLSFLLSIFLRINMPWATKLRLLVNSETMGQHE